MNHRYLYAEAEIKNWRDATRQEKEIFFGMPMPKSPMPKSPECKDLESPRVFTQADFLDLKQQREFFVINPHDSKRLCCLLCHRPWHWKYHFGGTKNARAHIRTRAHQYQLVQSPGYLWLKGQIVYAFYDQFPAKDYARALNLPHSDVATIEALGAPTAQSELVAQVLGWPLRKAADASPVRIVYIQQCPGKYNQGLCGLFAYTAK